MIKNKTTVVLMMTGANLHCGRKIRRLELNDDEHRAQGPEMSEEYMEHRLINL